MTYQAHADAVLALLAATPGSPPLVVLDGYVPTNTLPPYSVVYFAFESLDADDLTSNLDWQSLRLNCSIYVHSVGGNGKAARAVAARVRTALLDVTPTVTGRSCFPIRHIDNTVADRDESTGVLIVDIVDVYRLSSVPG